MLKTGKKIAIDLYTVQMTWVAWYLPIVYIVYFSLVWFLNEPEIQAMSLLTFTFQTATIFMLVCGILSSNIFLPKLIQNGVSRKSYFQGALFSAFGLAITIIGITAILYWITTLFEISILKYAVLSSLGPNSWALTIIIFIISVMIYFLIGWLIGSSFYRYGGSGGFISILISVIIVFLNDLLWVFSTPKPFIGLLNFSIPTPHVAIALIGSIFITIISSILVHRIVKDTPIKIV